MQLNHNMSNMSAVLKQSSTLCLDFPSESVFFKIRLQPSVWLAEIRRRSLLFDGTKITQQDRKIRPQNETLMLTYVSVRR